MRTAQRRIRKALANGDRAVQLVGNIACAPESWWRTEFREHPVAARRPKGIPQPPRQRRAKKPPKPPAKE